MDQPFIQISGDGGRGGQQHHQGQGPRQMHQPQIQHGFPPQGQGPRQMQQGFPPPPPRDAIPADLLNNRPVFEVADIRDHLVTESDMRRRLTQYKAVRFEKLTGQDPYDDDDGERAQSGWERAIKTQVQGMSKKDMLELISRLDLTTQDVIQKRAALSPTLQNQLDLELAKLSRDEYDPQNYVWTLTQIDQQLQEVPYFAPQHDVYIHRERKAHRTSKHHSKHKNKKKYSIPPAPRMEPKRYWERVSLTAYFKRSPRTQVNIVHLYDTFKRHQATMQYGAHQQQMMMNNQGFRGGPQQQNPQGPRPMQGPPPNGPVPIRGQPNQFQNGGQGGRQQQQPPPPPHPGLRPGGPGQGKGGKGVKVVKAKGNSDSDSDSSSNSDDSSSDSGQSRSTRTTDPPSSPFLVNKGPRRGPQGPHRSGSRPRNASRHVGARSRERSRKRPGKTYIVEPHNRRTPPIHRPPPPPHATFIPHQREQDDRERIQEAYHAGRADERFRRQSPIGAPIVTTYASDIDRIRDNAYQAGVDDTKREDRFAEEVVEIGPRLGRGTRIYQGPRPSVRTVDPRVLAREGLREQRPAAVFRDESLPRMDRLSMNDRVWEYHDRPPRRPEATRLGRSYGNEAFYESDIDDDFGSRPRGGVEIHVHPERPAPRTTYRTADHFGSLDSGANPFLPTLSPERGRSYERRRRFG